MGGGNKSQKSCERGNASLGHSVCSGGRTKARKPDHHDYRGKIGWQHSGVQYAMAFSQKIAVE